MNKPGLFSIVDSLLSRNVDLVIIGGHAVNFHGYIRATEDVDIIFRRSEVNERALHDVLTEFEGFWIGDETDSNTGLEKTVPASLQFIQSHHLIMVGTKFGYLDIFDFIPGMPHEPLDDLFASRQYSGQRPFVSLEWLKRMKTAAGRPQDLLDLEKLP